MGVHFHRGPVDALMASVGFPPFDSTGGRMWNIEYLLVGHKDHKYRLCVVAAKFGKPITALPTDWLANSPLKGMVDMHATQAAQGVVPQYFL